MSYPEVRIVDIAEINPGVGDIQQLPKSLQVSFVPMQAISELSASIEVTEVRSLAEVRKGFTPFQEGDVLFAKITPSMENGKIALAQGLTNGLGFGSTEFHVLRPTYLVIPEYLYYFMRQPFFRAAAKQRMRGAAGQQRVSDDFFYTYRIPLPPLSEQRQIVAILRKADELRRLRREAQREAQTLLPALFEEMFGDLAPTNTIEIGKILREEAGIVTGPFGTQLKVHELVSSGVPLYGIENVLVNKFFPETTKYVSEAKYTQLQRYTVQSDDVLITRMGTIGRACVVPESTPKSIISYHLFRLRTKDNCLPEFLAATLNYNPSVAEQLRNSAVGAVMSGLKSGTIRSLRIPLPEKDEQVKFVRAVEGFSGIVSAMQQATAHFDELFSSLLARAFSGELTEAWRERRSDALTLEAYVRDQRLAKRGRTSQVISSTSIPSSSAVGVPTVIVRGARDELVTCLSEQQRQVWEVVQKSEGYITAAIVSERISDATETASESEDLPLTRARQTLELLASAGLLLPVSLWNDEISDYVAAYRPLRPASDDEEQRGDEAYTSDLALLGAQ
jgi:type I restriction enzyme, S subunit